MNLILLLFINLNLFFPSRVINCRMKERWYSSMDDMDGDDQVFAAEQITKKRLRKGRTEYLVKWKGTYFSIRTEIGFHKGVGIVSSFLCITSNEYF